MGDQKGYKRKDLVPHVGEEVTVGRGGGYVSGELRDVGERFVYVRGDDGATSETAIGAVSSFVVSHTTETTVQPGDGA